MGPGINSVVDVGWGEPNPPDEDGGSDSLLQRLNAKVMKAHGVGLFKDQNAITE